eukprot:NODE_6490_length_530_cov_21.491315_g6325_i0.p1 GENE.NODE_6490_length_530_cov_21.491315_g6325_i0~~NODE_6490_length_530_cov_21.491315_g6325_i0.p1  ORF type:complete len:150 (-),score=16.29 NODE_6490_length_530_cov_21.491315_g6325_i0:19-468(-)
MATLVPLSGSLTLPIHITVGTIKIGRSPKLPTGSKVDADVRVSGVHCAIEGGSWLLQDLSTNGTFCNSTRVGKGQRVSLADGDIISFCFADHARASEEGLPSFRFKIEGSESPKQTPLIEHTPTSAALALTDLPSTSPHLNNDYSSDSI